MLQEETQELGKNCRCKGFGGNQSPANISFRDQRHPRSSKIEAGKMTLHLEMFDVGRASDELVTRFSRGGQDHTQQLDVGGMKADLTKVRQILFNLLSNACKFTDRGRSRLNVERITAANEEWIQFRIGDTGSG